MSPDPVAAADLPAAALAATALPEAVDWTPKRYGFRVGSVGFLVGERIRSEVVRSPVVSPLPHSPDWLLGLMNLRGNLVPVADLRALAGEPPGPRAAPSMVLVLDSGERAVAIPVDALPSALAELNPAEIMLSLPPLLAAHAGPAFEGAGHVWLAFDHDGFFRALARGPGAQP